MHSKQPKVSASAALANAQQGSDAPSTLTRINGLAIEAETYYAPPEVARFLGWRESTLAAYRCRPGGLPFFKHGRHVHYKGSDLIAFLAKLRREPGRPFG